MSDVERLRNASTVTTTKTQTANTATDATKQQQQQTKSIQRTAIIKQQSANQQQQYKQTTTSPTGAVKFQHQQLYQNQLYHQQLQPQKQQQYNNKTAHYNCKSSITVAQQNQQKQQQQHLHTQPQYQLITTASGEFLNNNNNSNDSDDNDISFIGHCFGLLLKVLFSPPGLVALVVGYSILGACIFPLLEAPQDVNTSAAIAKSREECLRELWIITEKLNVLYERNWSTLVHEQLRRFEDSIVAATRHTNNSSSIGMFGGSTTALRRYGNTFDATTADTTMLPTHWTFGEALLYSVTVITTIGHGSLTPRTAAGKIATILYALIGVPLMLMCLSSLGALLADALQCSYARICCHFERTHHHHHHHHQHHKHHAHQNQQQKHDNKLEHEKQRQPPHDLYQQQTHHLQVTGEKSGHLLEASAAALVINGSSGVGKYSRRCSADSLDDSALLKRGMSGCEQQEKGHELDCKNYKYDALISETSLSNGYDYNGSSNIGGCGIDSGDDSCRLLHNSPAKLNQNQILATTKINAPYYQQQQQQLKQRPNAMSMPTQTQKSLQQQHYQQLYSRSATPSPQHLQQQQTHEQQQQQQMHSTPLQTFHVATASSSPTRQQQQHQQVEHLPQSILRQYTTLQPHQYKQQQQQQYIAVPSGALVRFGLQTGNTATGAASVLSANNSNNCTTDGNGNVGIGVGATLIATGMPSNCYQTANVSVAGGTATATIYFPLATATHAQHQQQQSMTSASMPPAASNSAEGLTATSLANSGACGSQLLCNQPIVKYHTIQLTHARKQQQPLLGGEQVTLLGSAADVMPLPPPPAYQTATVHGIRRAKLLTKPLPPEISTLVADERDITCRHDLLIQQIAGSGCTGGGGGGDENNSTNTTTILTQTATSAPTTTTTPPTSQITTTNAANATNIAMLTAGLTATAATCSDNPPTITKTTTAMGTSLSGASSMVGSNATVDIMEDEEEHEQQRSGNCAHGTPSRVPLIPSSSSTNNAHSNNNNNNVNDDEQRTARSLFNATAASFHRHTLNTFQRNTAARKSATFSAQRRAASCNMYATTTQRNGKSNSCYGDPTTETSDDEETAYMQRDATMSTTTANEQLQLNKLGNNTKYNNKTCNHTTHSHHDYGRVVHNPSEVDDVVDGGAAAAVDDDDDHDDDDDVNSNAADADDAAGPQVPITIVLLILICYISLGTVIFAFWEDWSIVDGAYFCFVTLATIGYGDFMPERTFHGPHIQIFACCAYLLLGLVLVAMSFSILETQLMWKCKRIAVRLKLANDD